MRFLFVTNVMNEFMDFAPLGIMYLSSSLKDSGHEVSVCSSRFKEIVTAYNRFKPEVIGYAVTTGYHDYFLYINKKMKRAVGNSTYSIFGGPHATYFPEIIKEEGVDAVFRGESELAIVEFASVFNEPEILYRVKNLWVKDKSDPYRIHKNPVRPLIEDLDSLPFPDRALISDYTGKHAAFHTVMSSRGCPYNCTYCFNASYRNLYEGKGKMLRRRSVANLIAEIKQIKEQYPLQHLSFQDDEFCDSLEWLKEFSFSYRKEIGVSFSCNFRPNLVTQEKVALLKNAGLRSVTMAFESGSERVRNRILKRNLSDASMLAAAAIIKSQGIFLNVQNILGIPGSSLSDDFETLYLNVCARPDYAWVSIYAPYPGTELGEYAKSNGYFDGDLTCIKPTYHFRSILKISNKLQVENLHKLFALAVEYPWTLPMVKILMHLPLTPLFSLVRKFFKGWIYYKRNRMGMRFTLREKIKSACKFLFETGG